MTDATCWKKVIVQFPTALQVRLMDDSLTVLGTKYDAAGGIVLLNQKNVFSYTRPDADHVRLEGKLGGDSLTVRLRRLDPSKYLLLSRGFHWISELPFNR